MLLPIYFFLFSDILSVNVFNSPIYKYTGRKKEGEIICFFSDGYGRT